MSAKVRPFLASETLNRIEGYIDREEGDRLARAAAAVPAHEAIVEIGTASGAGAAYLAAGAAQGHGARLYCVDPYEADDEERSGRVDAGQRTLEFARHRLAYLELSATWLRGRSLDEARVWVGPPVGLLHVDGLHDFANVRADLRAWAEHMPRGALVICHDYFAPERIGEVARAVASCVDLFAEYGSHKWSRYPKRRGQWIGVKR